MWALHTHCQVLQGKDHGNRHGGHTQRTAKLLHWKPTCTAGILLSYSKFSLKAWKSFLCRGGGWPFLFQWVRALVLKVCLPLEHSLQSIIQDPLISWINAISSPKLDRITQCYFWLKIRCNCAYSVPWWHFLWLSCLCSHLRKCRFCSTPYRMWFDQLYSQSFPHFVSLGHSLSLAVRTAFPRTLWEQKPLGYGHFNFIHLLNKTTCAVSVGYNVFSVSTSTPTRKPKTKAGCELRSNQRSQIVFYYLDILSPFTLLRPNSVGTEAILSSALMKTFKIWSW